MADKIDLFDESLNTLRMLQIEQTEESALYSLGGIVVALKEAPSIQAKRGEKAASSEIKTEAAPSVAGQPSASAAMVSGSKVSQPSASMSPLRSEPPAKYRESQPEVPAPASSSTLTMEETQTNFLGDSSSEDEGEEEGEEEGS